MKKINNFFRGATLLFFLLSLSGYSQNCDFSLEMIDSFGDGWNGANMSVAVNGSTVLSNVSATGSGTTIPFNVNTGDVITTIYGAAGSYPSETSYNILDNTGAAVGAGNDNNITVTAACLTGTFYCSSVPSSGDGSGMTAVTLGTTTFNPTMPGWYEDLTGSPVVLQQGISAPVSVTYGHPYTYNTYVWIDFGDDGTFDAGDLVSSVNNSGTLDLSFTMPAGAPLGVHRMRISGADFGNTSANPCYEGFYGATVDLEVEVIAPLCDQAVIASSVEAPDCDNLQYFVDVNISSGGDALSITDGTTVWPIYDTGINTVGPFANSTSVILTVTHSDSSCDISLGSFIYNCPPPNDACANAEELICGSVASGSTVFATADNLGACDGNTFTTSKGVWYSITGTGGDIHLNTDDSSFDTKLGVFSGSCGTLVCVASDDDGGAGTRSDLTFSSNAGENYLIYMTGYSSFSSGDYTLTVDCICEAGIEGGGCQNVYSSSFAPLASTTLTVFGQYGIAPYTFEWSDGQTGATVTVSPTATTVYEVIVTDAAGCTNTLQTTVLVTDASCSNGNGNQAKVIVCHNGNELCISPNAVQAHLNHGDTIGSCDVIVSCDTPPLCDSRLKVPNSGAIDIPLDIEISWGASTGYVVGYLLSVGTTPGGGEIIDSEDVGTDLSYSLDGSLVFGTTYYVTIVSYNDNGEGSLCESSNFTTVEAPWTAEATPIACGETLAGNVLDGNVNDYLTGCGGVSGAQGVWYSFEGDGYEITASTCGLAGFDTEIAIFEGDTSLSCVANNDDDCGLQSEVTFLSTAGTTYYLYVTSFSPNSSNLGPFSVSLTCPGPPPALEACTFAESISCGDSVSASTSSYIANPELGTCTTSLGSAPGRFYKIEGTGDTIIASLCGSSFDTKIGVFSGNCSALSCVAGNDDSCSLQSEVSFLAEAGNLYYIYVTGFSASSGNFTLNVSCAQAPDPIGGEVVCGTGLTQEYCYDNNETTGILYTSSNGSALTIDFTSGIIEASTYDFLKIYDGVNASGTLIYQNGTSYGFSLAGVTATAASGSMFVSIVTDNSVSCQSGSSSATTWNYNVTCASSGRATTDVVWNMYPNPATNGEVELDLTQYLNTDLEIHMMDNSGKILINKAETNLQNPRYKMNTQNAANGLYFVRIVTESGVSVKKLIIAN